MQLGTNALGPFLLTLLLIPILQDTASISPAGSVRVTFAASMGAELLPPHGGITFDENRQPTVHQSTMVNYGQSKAASFLLAAGTAQRFGDHGIMTLVLMSCILIQDGLCTKKRLGFQPGYTQDRAPAKFVHFE
jgi:retinol dehydrogenase-12